MPNNFNSNVTGQCSSHLICSFKIIRPMSHKSRMQLKDDASPVRVLSLGLAGASRDEMSAALCGLRDCVRVLLSSTVVAVVEQMIGRTERVLVAYDEHLQKVVSHKVGRATGPVGHQVRGLGRLPPSDEGEIS